MQAAVLKSLVDYLNDMTTPGKPYQVAQGIAWSVVLPRQDAAKDLKAMLGDPRIRTLVGVVMPGGSSNVGTTRHYTADQPRGGAVREMTVSLSVFARSLKQYAFDGQILEIEDLIQELVGDFSTKDAAGVQAASVHEMSISMLEPDFVVLEFTVTLKYLTMSKPGLLKNPPIVLPGTGGDVWIPGTPLPQRPDGGYTLPDGRWIIFNPDGSITIMPDGIIIRPNADGTWTIPGLTVTIPLNPNGTLTLPNGWIVVFNADGTITLLPQHLIIQPNADGTWTLPDGTIIRKNPASVTLPDGTVIIINGDGTITLPPITVQPNADGTYTLPSGEIIRVNADGTITLADGTVIHRNADGSYTLPDGTRIFLTQNADGSISVIYVISPNPDGSYTLPDGTIVWPTPPSATVTFPDIIIIKDANGNPTIGQRISALMHFVMKFQRTTPLP